MNLELYKKIYLIGIGGIGMSALARYFNAKEKSVFGYDKVKSDLCIKLQNEGIQIDYIDSALNISQEIIKGKVSETLVIYTPAISEENQIFKFFIDNDYNIFKRAEILGMISKKVFTIAIAGTHGKTTTSTMLAHILHRSGYQVTAFLGGISRNYNTNLLLADKAKMLIVEADEFDRSFLEINADIAVITSVDTDHFDVYKDKRDLDLAFKQFVSQIKNKGLLLIEESIDIDFSKYSSIKKINYSVVNKADYFVENIIVKDARMVFDIMVLDKIDGVSQKISKDIELQMPGLHNVSNAVAAAVVALNLGLSFNDIVNGLVTFKGINRRFDKLIDTKELVYIDDYAHHPEEVSATICTTKQLYPLRELLVVFQPHLYSRTKNLAKDFALSLQGADDLVLLDIYPAREKPISGVNSQMLLDLCDNQKKELCSKDELLFVLERKRIDVLLTLGAGDIGSLVQPIKHMLN